MTQFLEAVQIALAAIWASKLRSFLTVLGNIVAVTSVIAVWSLVKGMDSSVSDAILSEFSADSFSVDRRGIITTVAGTGTAGFNGDGIPATQARLKETLVPLYSEDTPSLLTTAAVCRLSR